MTKGYRLWVTAGVIAATAAFAAPASAGGIEVGANGNFLTGGLSFTPGKALIKVGDTVTWRNTDFLVPHTATEDHNLWDLAGTYFPSPINPAGFAPGATVSRPFEAGSQTYYCRVHPTQMKGEIDVPVSLGLANVKTTVRVKVKLKRKKGQRKRRYRYKRVKRNVKYVTARWAPRAVAGGLVMDVERRSNGGAWTPFLTGTTTATGRFKAGKRGTIWDVRARLRRPNGGATGFSPAERITG